MQSEEGLIRKLKLFDLGRLLWRMGSKDPWRVGFLLVGKEKRKDAEVDREGFGQVGRGRERGDFSF